MPALTGSPIRLSLGARLIAYRGRLQSEDSQRGSAVYAAAFVRERRIVLEAALLTNRQRFRLILLHELFHFVWPRLGNQARNGFSGILLEEWKNGARGELGESSAVMKQRLRDAGGAGTVRQWRDYVCESFCDSAAWLYAGIEDNLPCTLGKRWRERRKAWFAATASAGVWKC